ncbi:MAG: hypothetical protein ABFD77_04655, partial [Thermotogota bacterium]
PRRRGQGSVMGDESKGTGTASSVDVRQLLAKAVVMTGREVDEPSAIASMEERRDNYGDSGAVDPPYDPESLLNYIELTPHVAPNISSYQVNIEGYGFRAVLIEPWMSDLDSQEARDAVRDALQIERWVEEEEAALAAAEKADGDGGTTPTDGEPGQPDSTTVEPGGEAEPPAEEPEAEGEDNEGVTESDIDEAIEKLRVQIRREKYLFDAFFKNCCSKMSFVKLRRVTRGDIEAHGWGAWEMLIQKTTGKLKRLNYIPGYTIRPLRDEGELVDAVEPDPITPISEGREISVPRRFRRYVQIVEDKKVYFKSPGDPRIVSRQTGKIYKSVAEMRRPKDDGGEGKEATEANELIYFSLHDPRTPCPPPRWIGNLLAVLGVREADELNYFYLDSSAIPPGILFVSGGKVPREMKDRLEQRLSAEFSGPEGKNKIFVVEAHPMAQKGNDRTMLPTMEFTSLREAQQTDATFTKYDERSADRIGASFRLPPMLRGYTPKDLNRATAIAALAFAETQVFSPERDDVDWIIDKEILPRIGVRLYAFKSNPPATKSPEEIAELIRVAAPQGGILPYEIRTLLSEALNVQLSTIDEQWGYWPMAMTLAGLGRGAEVAPSTDAGEGEGSLNQMGKVVARLDELQRRVEAVITDELRQAGYNLDVHAVFGDPAAEGKKGDGEGDTE